MRLYRVLLSSPHITNYIRELVVYEGHRLKGQDWIGIDQTLPLVLRRLTNLTTIEFRGLYWNVLPPDLMRSIRYVFQLPSLTFVDIHDARFANIDDFASLLCHTKGLTRLALTEINIMEPQPHEYHEVEEEEQRLDSHRRRHIVNLHLALYNYPIFVGWLLQSPAEVSHIHTLHISGARQPHDENAINRLLRAIGSSLKHFHFCLPWSLFRFNYISVADISIEFNSDIKFLHLEHIQSRGVKTANDSMLWLLRFLSTVGKSNRIEEIKFEVDILDHREGLVDWSAWGEVDSTLAGAHFEFLRKVEIRIWRETNGEEWFHNTCKNLVCGLPLLGARGVSINVY